MRPRGFRVLDPLHQLALAPGQTRGDEAGLQGLHHAGFVLSALGHRLRHVGVGQAVPGAAPQLQGNRKKKKKKKKDY